LIVNGALPKPDLAVIVDTEREKSQTWAYYEAILKPNLARVGVTLHRVRKSEFATVDLYATNGDLLLPVYTGDGWEATGLLLQRMEASRGDALGTRPRGRASGLVDRLFVR
jgi:hypothetical protein